MMIMVIMVRIMVIVCDDDYGENSGDSKGL